MLTAAGPQVLEFNVPLRRPRDAGRAARACAATCSSCCSPRTEPGGLAGAELEWDERWAVTLVLASAGYPAVVVEGRRDHRPRRGRARTSR